MPPALKKSADRKVYLKMFSRQLQMTKGKTLFEHYIDICKTGNVSIGDKYLIIFALLEEIGTIEDIKTEVPVDKLLKMADLESESLRLLSFDKLLGNIAAYWTSKDPNYRKYKEKFLSENQLHPFYQMLFEVIEDDKETKFIDNFLKHLKNLKECFKKRYVNDYNVDTLTTDYLCTIVKSAVLNDRRKIIDHILKHNNFDPTYKEFLKEIVTIEGIENEAPVDKLLKMADLGNENFRRDRLSLVDDLLGNIVAYWTSDVPNYQNYKKNFLNDNQLRPFYQMLFEAIEDDKETTFIDNYFENLENLQECFKKRYVNDYNVDTLSTDYLCTIVKSAVLNDRRKIIDHILKHNNFDTIYMEFLEKIGTIEDTKNDVPIDNLLQMADLENENARRDRLSLVDDLLGNIVAYWTSKDPNFKKYKKKFLCDNQLRPFYQMLFEVIQDDKETKFIDNYFKNLKNLQECFKKRNVNGYNVESLTTDCLWAIMRSAVLNDRRKIIDHILKQNNFVTIYLKFPPNIRTSGTANYFALKMLEVGYEMGRIGNGEIPETWITPEVLTNFLDSRIIYKGEDSIELDSSFLLHNYTKQVQVKSLADVEDNLKLIFWEDTRALEYIIESPSLRKSITHPVIATYIDLKMKKFKWIYWINLIMYIAFFMSPLTLLIAGYNPWLACISVVFLAARESFQYVCLEENYLKKSTNKLEVLLIIYSFIYILLVLVWGLSSNLMRFLSVILILFVTTDFLVSLRFAAPLFKFVIMLKKVAWTSIKYFIMNSIILIPFTLSFFILFIKEQNDKPKEKNENLEEKNEEDDVFQNFENFFTAFAKIVMMLSGEFAIEPHKLNYYQQVFLLIFVLTAFMLFNQYLAVIIGDVDKRRKDARCLMLMQNAEIIIKTSKYCLKNFEKLSTNKK